MEGTTSYYEEYAGRPWRVSIQGVLGAAPYRHAIGGFDDPGWGLAVYASSVHIGVELQPSPFLLGGSRSLGALVLSLNSGTEL